MSNFAWWYSLTFTHSYHFQWPWLYFYYSVLFFMYFKVTAVSDSFDWKFFVLMEVETLYNCWLCQVVHEHTNVFKFCTCWREIIDIFPCFKKKNPAILPSFSDTVIARSFKLCMIITLLEGLHCHCRLEKLHFKVTGVSEI